MKLYKRKLLELQRKKHSLTGIENYNRGLVTQPMGAAVASPP